MSHSTEDLRIRAVRPLVPAGILHEDFPLGDKAADLISDARRAIEGAIRGEDRRLVVVVGPCSIHDVDGARDYAAKLRRLADRYADELLVVMRCYFEKPRTSVGWKGLVNDPRMDGSFQINEGLRLARKLLSDVADIGLPAATEFLDTTIPQHLADFISWGAIGARTTESQTHRELASGLSMPIGFKNATNGSIQTAIDALKAAREPHWFPGATKEGVSAIFQTSGNTSCHVVLRGGSKGPNYDREHVVPASEKLKASGLPHRIMVDLSHANSGKDPYRQIVVAEDVAGQIRAGRSPIFGVMLESQLVAGRQDVVPGQSLVYGQSITDACLALDDTAGILESLARSV